MNKSSMHEVQVIHRWKEIDRRETNRGSFTTVEQCEDCGEKSTILHLDADSSPSSNSLPQTEALASMRGIGERFSEVARVLDEMFSELLDGTNYHTIDDLIDDIKKRSNDKVDGNELPHHQLQRWINTPKKFQAKTLLAYKQGLVCNRCDKLMYSTDQLTVDHIIPIRSHSELTNLQLLCEKCNQNKTDNAPDGRDVPPYAYTGEPCAHRITCVELDDLRSSYEAARETNVSGPRRLGKDRQSGRSPDSEDR